MQVVGAGFGRTGTLSVKAALERLGYGPCYHMTEVFDKPAHARHARLWDEAADRKAHGEPVDFEQVFSGYGSTVDWPGCFFWRELVEAYPDAKVLLTVRDPERWYESVRATIAPGPQAGPGGRLPSPESKAGQALINMVSLLAPAFGHAPSMVEKVILDGTFSGRLDEREHATSVFEGHVEEVKRTIPGDRLLVYEVTEGWEPLCSFLGVEVPDEPFPHLNERDAFPRVMGRGLLRAAAPRLAAASALGLAMLAAARLLRAPRR